jgi:aminoglycoside phosphotransferase (APT) family kinase protein
LSRNFGIDPALVDFAILDAWMDGEGFPRGTFEQVETLAGGTQNTLIRFERGGRLYVLRRGPRHLRPISNDVMRREMRVLSALASSDVPHPQFYAGCGDESVMNGAVFYLMEAVDGFNPSTGLPPLHAGDASIRHAMGLSIADGAAALGRVDYLVAGLDGLGRPDGFIERQVERWLSELASYARFDGYPGPEIPGVDAVAAWLDDNRPTSWSPGILHGDYHLGNVLYRYDSPQLAAIVDWEMCTIGDPLLDLGWLLATWPDADQPAVGTGGTLAAAGGLPSTAEVVARYAQGSSRDLSAIAWYGVLACFKLGIVLEGTHARAFAGKAPKPIGDMLHASTLSLFHRAQTMIATG